jgi:hypothetical protein
MGGQRDDIIIRLPIAMRPSTSWNGLVSRCGAEGAAATEGALIDKFKRKWLTVEVATLLPSPRVMAVLDRLGTISSAPQFICRDHGPRGIALAGRRSLAQCQRVTLDMGPGSASEKREGSDSIGPIPTHLCIGTFSTRWEKDWPGSPPLPSTIMKRGRMVAWAIERPRNSRVRDSQVVACWGVLWFSRANCLGDANP